MATQLVTLDFSTAPTPSAPFVPFIGQAPDPCAQTFCLGRPFALERGATLDHLELTYETHGVLNAKGDNVVLICHALTGDAHAARCSRDDHACRDGWWDALVGPDKIIDTNSFFVVSTNLLGGCYGSTGPASTNPATGCCYGPDFPRITIRDMVHAQKHLLDFLGVNHLAAVIGGSLGGMQVLEWALLYPTFVGAIVPIATCSRHSPWAIGLNQTARLAITTDPEYCDGRYTTQPRRGMAVARMVAMLSYRHMNSFSERFGRDQHTHGRTFNDCFIDSPGFAVENYLRYQGGKLADRFDANTYLTLSHAMDSHDITRGRGEIREVLGSIKNPALVIGINSDLLYTAAENQELATLLPNSGYLEISSSHGHDGFLIEFEQINTFLRNFFINLSQGAAQ